MKDGSRSTGKYSEEDRNALGNQGCWLRHLDRQGEVKGCTLSIVGSRPQPAAMRLHNGTADGQSHAAALRLRSKERRKDLIHLLHWQPHARVADQELELTVLQFRLHRKLSARVCHRFDGLKHEVHEHLLQLHAIHHDFGQVGGEFRARRNRVSIGLPFQQREHFLDNSVDVDQLTLLEETSCKGIVYGR